MARTLERPLRPSPHPCLPPSPFTYRAARDAGVSRWHLQTMVDNGVLRRLLVNVYGEADLEDTIELRVQAAALVLPPHAVVVDQTAAWIWGYDARRPDELISVPPLTVFVPPGHKRVTRAEAAGGERQLGQSDVTKVNGLLVTTPVRTCLDLACNLSAYEALAALDGLSRSRHIPIVDLLAQLPRYRGRRGVVQARRLVPLADARSESPGESFTRLAIIDAGLPRPQLQWWVHRDGVPVFRLDLAYPELKICVEYDGVKFHLAPERQEADKRRREWLRAQGWYVIVVDKDSFRGPALDRWLGELRGVLEQRRMSLLQEAVVF